MPESGQVESGQVEKDAISRRAYEIWEAEGRPHGRDREHWEAAAQQIGTATPAPEDFRTEEPTPGLDAAVKKPATRRKKAAVVEDAGEVPAEPKPARKRRAAAPAP